MAKLTPHGAIVQLIGNTFGSGDEWADDVLGAIEGAGYTIVSTDTLETALNFGYGKEPTPAGAIARANLREVIERNL